MRRGLMIAALAIIAAIFAAMSSCRAALAADKCWFIFQKSGGSGNHEIHLTETAIRVDSLSTGIITIAKAPDWKIHRFNKKKQLQFSCDFNSWRLREMSGFLNDFFGKWQTWSKVPSSTLVLGQPVTIFEWKSRHKKPPVNRPSARTLVAMYDTVEDNKSQKFWVWNHSGFRRQAQILSTLYAAPDPPGIILRNDVTLFSIKESRHLLLTADIKQIDQPKGIFEKPEGYKVTTKYSDFLLNPQDEVFMQLFGE